MRAYLSVDLEGLPFVVSPLHLMPGKPLYDEARRILTKLTVAAAEELWKQGFDKVWVADSHGLMVNLLVDDLPEYVEVIRGWPRPLSMVIDVQGSDAALFLGYHAKAGSERATFDHTYSGVIASLKVNGMEVSEYLLNAYIAGHYNVPVIMVAGDAKLLEEVSIHTPWAARVELKRAYSRYAARSPSLAKLVKEVKRGVREGVRALKEGRAKPLKLDKPVRVEVAFVNSGYADVAALLPGASRSGQVVKFEAEDVVSAAKALHLVVLAALGARKLLE